MIKQEQSITALVEKLPEVYQPIFKHPEFTAQASRSCLDRLERISSVYNYISEEKGRPLKVLDLGCAQGFFSLNLAELGAIVTAIDYSQPNIDVCNKLASENNNLKVEFFLGSIETVINERVMEGEFDLVLGLSVFHHLVYEHGADFVFDLFQQLSSKVETGIFEFALNTEPLYWAESQPKDPRELIECYSFSHYLSMYGTHLSSVERPLFFASNKYWHIEDMYGVIETYMQRSHQLDNFYHGNNRRYFFSENKTIKIFLDNESGTNHKEILNESLFLQKEIKGFRTAKLISYGNFEHESWMVRTTIPGKLLLDVIINNENYDDEKIISDLLEQVTILEKNGLYHNDLRPWNILIGDDGLVYIIDYGSISSQVLDGDDLYGQLLSFFVLIKEIAQHRIREQGSQRPPFISPYDFPEKYQKCLSLIWAMPSQKWSFQSVEEAFNNSSDMQVDVPVSAMLESHLSTTVNFLSWQFTQLQSDFSAKFEQLNQKIEENNRLLIENFSGISDVKSDKMEKCYQEHFLEVKEKVENLSSKIHGLNEENKAQFLTMHSARVNDSVHNGVSQDFSSHSSDSEKEILSNEVNELRQAALHLRKELDAVYDCNSWKITYPLRIVSKSAKSLFKPRTLASRIKAALKKKSSQLVPIVKRFVENRPLLKQRAMRFLNRHPGLKYKLKKRISVVNINMDSVSTFNKVNEPEIHIEHMEHNQSYSIKNPGVNEKQKSVLESWLN
ncbi:methyltransferase domain-containing protein [Pantoea agglomerans]|uniref:methyltransferase domain-containing protein n=1 Tax=Enterobacter agglomerans TaxID=549 RepID=UPI00301B961D